MVFAHDQFVIFELFGGNTILLFFYNNVIIVLPLESKQLEPLVRGPYDNYNFVMNY